MIDYIITEQDEKYFKTEIVINNIKFCGQGNMGKDQPTYAYQPEDMPHLTAIHVSEDTLNYILESKKEKEYIRKLKKVKKAIEEFREFINGVNDERR